MTVSSLYGDWQAKALNTITNALIKGNMHIAVISAPPGAGKTALALLFASVHEKHFTGGIRKITSQSLVEVSQSVLQLTHRPTLIIIDGLSVGMSTNPNLETALRTIISQFPETRFLILSPKDLNFLPDLAVHVQYDLTSRGKNSGTYQFWAGNQMVYIGRASQSVFERLLMHLGPRANARYDPEQSNQPIFGDNDKVAELSNPLTVPGLVGPDGRPLVPGSELHKLIVTDIRSVSSRLLEYLADHPTDLYKLTARQFEEVVAEIFVRLGYTVELGPGSNDGGIDLCAAKKDLVSVLYLVQCKLYSPSNPVQVRYVRDLYGVVEAKRASAGILATTSYFTKGAREFQEDVGCRLSLRDYNGIQEWLRIIRR